MKEMKITIGILLLLCILLLGLLYFFQEKLIFFPQKLEPNYPYNFKRNFKELNIKTSDNKLLNALLFKADNSKGLIFYLHGNAGSLDSWGSVATFYLDRNYDVFILDYRGFGKSEGKISGEEQLYDDNQIAYDKIKETYREEDIIVLGYSLGSGLAAKLASENNPKLLILQAPYYSFKELVGKQYFFPTFLLKYKIRTDKFLKKTKCPVILFHGSKDEVIDHKWAVKLKETFKDKVQLITLDGEGHNGMTDNKEYRKEMKKILEY